MPVPPFLAELTPQTPIEVPADVRQVIAEPAPPVPGRRWLIRGRTVSAPVNQGDDDMRLLATRQYRSPEAACDAMNAKIHEFITANPSYKVYHLNLNTVQGGRSMNVNYGHPSEAIGPARFYGYAELRPRRDGPSPDDD